MWLPYNYYVPSTYDSLGVSVVCTVLRQTFVFYSVLRWFLSKWQSWSSWFRHLLAGSTLLPAALAWEVMQSPLSIHLTVCWSISFHSLNRVAFDLDILHVNGHDHSSFGIEGQGQRSVSFFRSQGQRLKRGQWTSILCEGQIYSIKRWLI